MQHDLKKAARYLARRDPVLARVISQVDLKPHRRHTSYFQALVDAIISQQLSDKAATTIIKRFRGLFPGRSFPSPRQVAATSIAKLRSVGLSGQKASYIRDLALHLVEGKINFRRVGRLSDGDILVQLTAVRGIGRWTAEMFLMFALQRPDIFSYGDLGLRNALQKLYNLRRHPTPKQAERITNAWSPYRTIACRYLWASLTLTSDERQA